MNATNRTIIGRTYRPLHQLNSSGIGKGRLVTKCMSEARGRGIPLSVRVRVQVQTPTYLALRNDVIISRLYFAS